MEADACPRCYRPIEPPGVTSRFRSKSAGDILVCSWCGELEAAVERYGWEITGPSEWPLRTGDLLLETLLVYEDARAAAGNDLLDWYSAECHGHHLRPRPLRRRR